MPFSVATIIYSVRTRMKAMETNEALLLSMYTRNLSMKALCWKTRVTSRLC
jgi:hypothetical protein